MTKRKGVQKMSKRGRERERSRPAVDRRFPTDGKVSSLLHRILTYLRQANIILHDSIADYPLIGAVDIALQFSSMETSVFPAIH